MRNPHALGFFGLAVVLTTAGCANFGDQNVAISSSAFQGYTHAKYEEGPVKTERYVFMAGNYYPGAVVDHSLERTTFRELAGMLAPELARRQFLPAPDVSHADLLLLVHWGVTSPAEKMDTLLARDPPSLAGQTGPDPNSGADWNVRSAQPGDSFSGLLDPELTERFSGVTENVALEAGFQMSETRMESLGVELRSGDTIKLLGYGRHLRKFGDRPVATAEEEMLRFDVTTERYFVVIQAYDLRKIMNRKPRLVWSLHLNMRSPGNRFRDAFAVMGRAGVNYFGRSVDHVVTEDITVRAGRVDVGDVIIIDEK